MPRRTKAKNGKANNRKPKNGNGNGKGKKKFTTKPKPTKSRQSVAKSFNKDMYGSFTRY
jgi:hypothetical protein